MNEDDSRLLRYLAATVEGIRDDVGSLKEQMATKDDLAAVEARLEAKMATKEDLAAVEARLEAKMATKEDVAAIRGDIEQVQVRVDGVDRTLTTRMDDMDNRISRLRSAVYLLAKDEPAVRRLLGE